MQFVVAFQRLKKLACAEKIGKLFVANQIAQ